MDSKTQKGTSIPALLLVHKCKKKKTSQCKRTENKMQTEHLTASFGSADLLSVILIAITLLL